MHRVRIYVNLVVNYCYTIIVVLQRGI